MAGNMTKGTDFISLISDASPIAKFVLFSLIIFSVISWAVIIFKLVEYSKAKKNSLKFLDYFRKARNLADINRFANSLKNTPLATIFKYGFNEMTIQRAPEMAAKGFNAERINRELIRGSKEEIVRLEKLNGFLATTATVTPFIGLFGTVWGIMSSFHQIGIQMNANLATVAPGIAEALIATALGLFAAIPAVIFYNLLLNKLKVLISMMEDFSLEFLNISERLK